MLIDIPKSLQASVGMRVRQGHWNDLANHRIFMDDIAKKCNVNNREDWYNMTTKKIQHYGGSGLLTKYNGSLFKLLQNVYSDHNWDVRKFKLPQKYWHDLANQKSFLDHLAKKLNITSIEGWYKVTVPILQANGGNGLLKKYKVSLHTLLSTVYPEYKQSCRDAILSITRDLKLTKVEDSIKVAHKYLDSQLLRQHGHSATKLVATCFPELKLPLPTRAKYAPVIGHWKSLSNQREYFDNLAKKLDIKEPDDWYYISVRQIEKQFGGRGILNRYYNGSLIKALQAIYPDHKWIPPTRKEFGRNSKNQYLLLQFIKQVFPHHKVELNYHFVEYKFSKYGKSIEFDIFVPDLSLAFEYNGEQHYMSIPFFNDVGLTKKRDKNKQVICKYSGITLIIIPFWWDRTIDSIAQTICYARPDIQFTSKYVGAIIPTEMPIQQERAIYYPVRSVELLQEG